MELSCNHVYVHSLPSQKKLLIFNMNVVLCYFPQYVILQDNVRVFGRNIDKSKIEVKVGVEHFLVNAFQKFYIII